MQDIIKVPEAPTAHTHGIRVKQPVPKWDKTLFGGMDTRVIQLGKVKLEDLRAMVSKLPESMIDMNDAGGDRHANMRRHRAAGCVTFHGQRTKRLFSSMVDAADEMGLSDGLTESLVGAWAFQPGYGPGIKAVVLKHMDGLIALQKEELDYRERQVKRLAVKRKVLAATANKEATKKKTKKKVAKKKVAKKKAKKKAARKPRK